MSQNIIQVHIDGEEYAVTDVIEREIKLSEGVKIYMPFRLNVKNNQPKEIKKSEQKTTNRKRADNI